MTGQEVRTEIRVLIGDDDPANEAYTDLQLNNFIGAAITRLNRKIVTPALPFQFASGVFYSVQPNSTQADLIVLQSSCMIFTRKQFELAQRAVSVKQDENSVDTSVFANGLADAISGPQGVCTQVDVAIKNYLNTVGSAAANAGENVWSGNSKLYEDVDFDGQGMERIYRPRQSSFQQRSKTGGSSFTDDIFRVSDG